MRYFIALEIPSQNIPQFQSIQQSLSNLIPQVKITNLEKIHLTLAFIGEQSNELLPDLENILQSAAAGISAFEVTPAYIDGFPNLHHPNILWVGVKGDIDKVLQIRERIKDGLESLKLSVDERRFIPHITIAKFNSNFKINKNTEVELEKIMAQPFDPIKITSIKLFESIPQEGFHKHNVLAEIKLK
jgi:RNA 2',3'-cyclic 3'-phosphodiesterase